MLFTEKTLEALEYDKIIARLVECASTAGAKARAAALLPSDDYETVLLRQARTEDAKRLLSHKGYPPFSGAESVVAADRAYKGATLSPRELLDVAALLYSARMCLDYIRADRVFETSLDEIFERLMPDRALEEAIKRAILSEEMIADEASPALAEIRRKIRHANNRIKETLQSYVGGARLKYLQENIVTMRGGRYVVPVKAEYRNEMKGLVHDTSSSGATLFIEPIAVVEANNELKSLAAAEKNEIERILAELSAEVASRSSMIALNDRNITDLAFAFACATLAVSMRAERPVVVDRREISLHRARHPLLRSDTVVPIDVSLGKDYDTLVITGPNTGGKTVTLKTMGLLSLMAQAGLQIPAEAESRIGVFSEVLADIGDEQSIEASLSTFSAHMVNVIDILSRVSDRSMVLFDELGSGTDPVEGAALAIAILEQVRARGGMAAATTHYAELKVYALDTPRVCNASCEFDVETLRPTYKLIVGTPGRSNAFAISEKLGMPAEVIERAGRLIEHDSKRFEDVIDRLDSDRVAMERERETAERLRKEYEAFKANAEKKLQEKIAKSEEEISKQTLKARQILESARASSEFIFRQLEELKKQENKEKRDEMMNAAREQIRRTLRESSEAYASTGIREAVADEEYRLPRPLKTGDTVYLVSLGRTGTVTALADKNGKYAVTSGVLKTKVAEGELRLVDEAHPSPPREK